MVHLAKYHDVDQFKLYGNYLKTPSGEFFPLHAKCGGHLLLELNIYTNKKD